MRYDPPPDDRIGGGNPLVTERQTSPEGRTHILQKEPARKLTNLLNIPVLVETGEASYRSAYDDFTVHFMRQAGVKVKHLKLADEGIHGNGHLQFLELNNLEIIELLERWIATII